MRLFFAVLLAFCADRIDADSLITWPLTNEAATPVDGGASNALLIVGQFDRVSPGSGGGGGSFDWIRADPDAGRTLSIGVASYSLADSRWTYGRAAGGWRAGENMVVEGLASFGGGNSGGTHFGYCVLDAALDYQIVPAVWLKAEDKFVDIGDSHGHLLKVGTLLVPTNRIVVDLGYARSAGGNLNSEIISGRVDWSAADARWFGGYAHGRAVPDLFGVDVGGGMPSQASREWFVGVAIPVSPLELTGVFDTVEVNASRRRTFTFSIRMPLGRT